MKSITSRNFKNYLFLGVLFFLCSISTLVFTISDLWAENAIAPSLQAEIERTHEIQAILQILANRPQLEWTLAKKQQLRGYVSNLKNQIEYAESEINQLNSVLGGLGEENGGGSTSSANSLPEVEALKQNKQLELAQLRFPCSIPRKPSSNSTNISGSSRAKTSTPVMTLFGYRPPA